MTRVMNVRSIVRTSLLAAMLTAVATPAAAQVVHSISFGAGLFVPRAESSRAEGDVLVADLNQPVIPGSSVTGSLAFKISDFKTVPVFAEWHIAFNDHVEVAVGGGFTNASVPSVYRDLVNGHDTDTTADDTEIQQTLKLQTIPITAVVRFLGGRPGHVQPYGGGGLIVSFFNYKETGDFVDLSDGTIFNATYKVNDVAFGPVILGGLRIPLGGDIYAINAEARYQWIVGKTGGAPNFLDDKLDLSGWSILGSFLVRF